jgi:hypothetical protein
MRRLGYCHLVPRGAYDNRTRQILRHFAGIYCDCFALESFVEECKFEDN